MDRNSTRGRGPWRDEPGVEIIPPDRSSERSRDQPRFAAGRANEQSPWDAGDGRHSGRAFDNRIFLMRPGPLAFLAAAVLIGALSIAAFVAIIGAVLFWLPAAGAIVLAVVLWSRARRWLQRMP
jgi:hypothetical protein